MNIGIFAAGTVGYRAIQIFIERKVYPSFLLLDPEDFQDHNGHILKIVKDINIPILISKDQEETEVFIKSINPDLIITAWWPYILKKNIIQISKSGILNFHPSYLPYNKGKNPNFWAIVDETKFGVTLHFIDEGIDTGDICYQKEIPVTWEDTGETLYNKAIESIIDLFSCHFEEIINLDIPRKKQQQGTHHYFKEIHKKSEINLLDEYKAKDLFNILRARTFNGKPAAYFYDNDEKYEITVQIKKIKN